VRSAPGVVGGTVSVGMGGRVAPGVTAAGNGVITVAWGVVDPVAGNAVRVGVTPGGIVAVGEAPGTAVDATTVGVLVAPGAVVAVGTGVEVAIGMGVEVGVGVADGDSRVSVGVARVVGVAVGSA
jgi:hypothetical protein